MDITVDGVKYELPALDTVTIGESKIIKRHSGKTLDELFEIEGLDGGVIGGLLAVAIKRGDPSLKDVDLDAKVDAVNMFEIMEELTVAAGEAEDPTQGGQPPVESDLKPSSEEPTPSSGTSGETDSEHSLEKSNPVSTGVPSLDSTATSDPMTLVP